MWKSVSCAVQGKGHIQTGIPCQDKALTLARNSVNIIALADGAGSAKLSHYGAEQAVICVAEHISDNFANLIENNDGKQVKQQILRAVRYSLESLATERECNLSDLACTLLVVAVFEDNFLIIHIGDGVIGYLKNEELKIASLPDKGEFANTTTFVTSDKALASMKLIKGKIEDIAGFVIMSDGTEHSLYDKRTKSLTEATISLMRSACSLEAGVLEKQLFNTLDSVIAKKTQDDCSIALLARPIGMLREVGQESEGLPKEFQVKFMRLVAFIAAKFKSGLSNLIRLFPNNGER